MASSDIYVLKKKQKTIKKLSFRQPFNQDVDVAYEACFFFSGIFYGGFLGAGTIAPRNRYSSFFHPTKAGEVALGGNVPLRLGLAGRAPHLG